MRTFATFTIALASLIACGGDTPANDGSDDTSASSTAPTTTGATASTTTADVTSGPTTTATTLDTTADATTGAASSSDGSSDDGSSSTGLPPPEDCGDGAFAPGMAPHYAHPIASLAAPADLALADFDDDGDLDIAVSTGSALDPSLAGVHLLLNQGDGTFPPPVELPGGDGSIERIAAVAIADDTVDLIGVSWDPDAPAIRSWRGNGDGTFAAPVVAFGGSQADQIATGDLDGDGRVDLFGGGLSNFFIALGTADESFEPAYNPGLSAGGVAVGDLDHDGHLDAILSHGSGFDVARGDGTAQLVEAGTYESRGLTLVRDLALADFDGDHRLDAVAFAVAELALRHGDGMAGFGDELRLELLGVTDGTTVDLDQDGCDDLVGRAQDRVYIVGGRDDRTLAEPWTFLSPVGHPIAMVRAGDLDGDAIPDLVVLGRANGTTEGEVAALRSVESE